MDGKGRETWQLGTWRSRKFVLPSFGARLSHCCGGRVGVGPTIASWIAEGRRPWATWKPIGDLGEICFSRSASTMGF
eukprot:6998419-Prymnesium_polylepis.1